MCDVVGVKKKFPKTYDSLRYNGVRFFSSIKRHEKIFSLEISATYTIFFSDITHSPPPHQKSNGRPLSQERLRGPDFLNGKMVVCTCEPASFWRENSTAIVIQVRVIV